MSDQHERLVDAFLEDLATAPVPAGLASNVARRARNERQQAIRRPVPWWGIAAAVGVVALAGLGVAIAGPKPSPSTAVIAPSASTSASPAATPQPTPVPSDLLLVTPSPVAPPSPTVPATYPPNGFVDQPTWRINLPEGGTPFAVLVVDPAQDVVGVRSAPRQFFPSLKFQGAVLPGRDDHSIDVYWRSSVCDGWETASIGTDHTITLVATPVDTTCDPGSVVRGFELRFADKLSPSQFTLVTGAPARYPPAGVEVGVAFTDANHGTIALGNGLAGVEDTGDGGVTWRITNLTNGMPTGIAAAGDTTWLAISCDPSQWDQCAAGVYRRTGGTWSHVLAMDPGPIAASGDTIAVVEQPLVADSSGFVPVPTGIRLTRDGGASWMRLATPCTSPDTRLTGLALNPSASPMVVCEGEGATGQADKLLLTYDGLSGAWIKVVQLPSAGHTMGLSTAWTVSSALHPPLSGLLWGDRSALLTTADGGLTWVAHRDVADGDVRIVQAGQAWVSGGGMVLVYDPDRSARLLLTSTDGKTWTEVTAFRDVPCCGG